MSASAPEPAALRDAARHVVAVLVRQAGVAQLAAVEDAVQGALALGLERWPGEGPPRDLRAWLYRVAQRRLQDGRRKGARRRRLLRDGAREPPPQPAPEAALPGELKDELLRMLFVCADPALSRDGQLVLALKVLVGFDVRAIAALLFTREATVYKRLGRARARLRAEAPRLDAPLAPEALKARRPAVLHMLYVLFTEGHLSAHPEHALRRELCDEALGLGLRVAGHEGLDGPEVKALVALMTLHRARLPARQDALGGLLLLGEQDRAAVDGGEVARGLAWLRASATGEAPSRYHLEAAIVAEHALAPSLAETRWDRIARYYALLERVAPSPLHRAARALALAETAGPEAGLALLAATRAPLWLVDASEWSATLADLHRRAGHAEEAARHRERALAAAPTPAVRAALERRLAPRGD